jgi:nicotinamidase-related amidase
MRPRNAGNGRGDNGQEWNKPAADPPLRKVVGDIPMYDRTTINAWEDAEFNEAVKATKRKKLIMTALWTEACLTYPSLDAVREGYEVYPVVDAVGGLSVESHNAGLRRIEQAGAKPINWAMLACELQRDWLRKETVPAFMTFLSKLAAPWALISPFEEKAGPEARQKKRVPSITKKTNRC